MLLALERRRAPRGGGTLESELQRVVWRPPTHAVIAGRDVLVQLWETESPSEGMRAVKLWCEERKLREGERPGAHA